MGLLESKWISKAYDKIFFQGDYCNEHNQNTKSKYIQWLVTEIGTNLS